MNDIKIKTGRAPRKQLIMAASTSDAGPWCSVSLVKFLEIQGASENSVFLIERRDNSTNIPPVEITIRGATRKPVNIPRGEIRVKRIKSSKEPITAYAYCGD